MSAVTAQCSRCAHLTMRGQSKDHAAVGLYRCPKGPPWEFRSVTKPHECARFAAVAEKDLPARLAFEAEQK